jgi:very-short-patch-repair endonuclease
LTKSLFSGRLKRQLSVKERDLSRDKKALFSNAWLILADESLPEPTPEYKFSAVIGRRHRFDLSWPRYKIAVEVDGGQYMKHGGRHSRDSDREKHNIATLLGWRVFRYSTQKLENDPHSPVAEVECFLKDNMKSRASAGFKFKACNMVRDWRK